MGGRSRRRKALLTVARLARIGAWEAVPVSPQQMSSELGTRANKVVDLGPYGAQMASIQTGKRARACPAPTKKPNLGGSLDAAG